MNKNSLFGIQYPSIWKQEQDNLYRSSYLQKKKTISQTG
jgi:hypothetical protein